MRIAIGCDHRGAKVAKKLIYDLLLRDHYVDDKRDQDLFTEDGALGAFLITDAACDDSHDKERDGKDTKIKRIFYSKDKQNSQDKQNKQDKQSVVLEQTSDSAASSVPRSIDYPNVAAAVAEKVANGEADYGILICATGIGMCIVANKFKGVRAAICYDEVAAELSRRHNNANILCLSSDFIGLDILETITRKWLDSPYDGGRHQKRVELIDKIEEKTGL